MIEVVHLTAHLGGGVGKALSELVVATHAAQAPVRHVFACLERPEKSHFLECIERHGGEVLVAPEQEELVTRLAKADIVQLEWWNHPATIATLCNLPLLPMRLIVWCHVSGLCTPLIPPALVEASHRFILTSHCSLAVEGVSMAVAKDPGRIEVISSAGGADALPKIERRLANRKGTPVSVGYLGSLNFAKLHPNFVPWVASVRMPDFRLRLIGEPVNQAVLKNQAEALGRPNLLEFAGYTSDVASALASLDVMAYLLNPRHYGTAENALIEAMAMGVVPIVLDNPAERCIVKDGVTGIVISSGNQLADAIDRLVKNPEERCALSVQASLDARRRFSSARMMSAFQEQYLSLVTQRGHPIAFKRIFGNNPADWFLSCQEQSASFFDNYSKTSFKENFFPYELFEKTKGSPFHFLSYFQDDVKLAQWLNNIKKAHKNPK